MAIHNIACDQATVSTVNQLHEDIVHLEALQPDIAIHICALCVLKVLSNSVSKAMLAQGKEETQETAIIVDMFNKFFDCLNVTNFSAGMHSRNPFKSPYCRTKTDFRLKVIMFLNR